jgi:hypothetical protein
VSENLVPFGLPDLWFDIARIDFPPFLFGANNVEESV